MLPKPPTKPSGADLFRSELDQILDPEHELVRLAKLIDWKKLEAHFGRLYIDRSGRPGLPTRLMVGLHLLQHAKGLSDEAVCAAWLENPYFQYFCGATYFQHKLPLDRSSMTRWRKRAGTEDLEKILAETLAAAQRAKAVEPKAFERVTVDSTAQTKAIAHPTDSGLYMRAIEWMNRFADRHGLTLRQSFIRLAKRCRVQVARQIHSRAHKQALREVRRMRTFTGRLLRDIVRKVGEDLQLQEAFKPVADPILQLLAQTTGSKKKIYALHAPEVECIAKGKARTRYEFGTKASFAVINAKSKKGSDKIQGQYVVGAQACPNLPYDGHTLKDQIKQVERLTGTKVKRAYVDQGYRGHGVTETEVYISRARGITSPTIKRELKRRSAIEPVIGHMKSDGKLERNWLAGTHGDAVNVLLVAAGHNIRLLLNWLKSFCAFIMALSLALTQTTNTADYRQITA